jgi:hypothetical protein
MEKEEVSQRRDVVTKIWSFCGEKVNEWRRGDFRILLHPVGKPHVDWKHTSKLEDFNLPDERPSCPPRCWRSLDRCFWSWSTYGPLGTQKTRRQAFSKDLLRLSLCSKIFDTLGHAIKLWSKRNVDKDLRTRGWKCFCKWKERKAEISTIQIRVVAPKIKWRRCPPVLQRSGMDVKFVSIGVEMDVSKSNADVSKRKCVRVLR